MNTPVASVRVATSTDSPSVETTSQSTEASTKPTVTESKAPNGRKISYTKFLRRISDAELNHELGKRVKAQDVFGVVLSTIFNSPVSRPAIRQSAIVRRRYLDNEKRAEQKKAQA